MDSIILTVCFIWSLLFKYSKSSFVRASPSQKWSTLFVSGSLILYWFFDCFILCFISYLKSLYSSNLLLFYSSRPSSLSVISHNFLDQYRPEYIFIFLRLCFLVLLCSFIAFLMEKMLSLLFMWLVFTPLDRGFIIVNLMPRSSKNFSCLLFVLFSCRLEKNLLAFLIGG